MRCFILALTSEVFSLAWTLVGCCSLALAQMQPYSLVLAQLQCFSLVLAPVRVGNLGTETREVLQSGTGTRESSPSLEGLLQYNKPHSSGLLQLRLRLFLVCGPNIAGAMGAASPAMLGPG